MRKEKQTQALSWAAVRAWVFGGVGAVAFCLGAARVVASVFESAEKYEILLPWAGWGLLILSGGVGGLIASLMTGRSSLLPAGIAGGIQILLLFLLGLLFAKGICLPGELGLRALAVLGGSLGVGLALILTKGRKKRKKTARKR